jgi:hypothetical protein
MRPVTGVDDAERSTSPSAASKLARPLRPYADIFRIPGARRFSAAGVIGRMPMSMFGLGTVLLISASTGSYGVAGAVSAAGSLGYALASPRADLRDLSVRAHHRAHADRRLPPAVAGVPAAGIAPQGLFWAYSPASARTSLTYHVAWL